MAPADVTFGKARKIFAKIHPSAKKPIECKLVVGDVVRIPLDSHIFTKVLQFRLKSERKDLIF